MNLTPITSLDVRGKRLVVRADLNVPIADGKVTDRTRIDRFAAGMVPLLEAGARIVILTHLGRPNGEMNPAYSVDKLRPVLSEALGRPIRYCDVSVGRAAEDHANALNDGEVLLCENVRYNRGEEINDPKLAAGYARLGDIYVNDAFSCAHRAHASTEAIAGMMPATAGPLLLEELEALSNALEAPQRPAVAIVGGAKVSTKIDVLKNLVTKLDAIIIGGGMANTFLFADGIQVGNSLHEPDQVETVREIRELAIRSGCKLLVPNDIVYARELRKNARKYVAPADKCPPDAMILDAGPKSLSRFEGEIASAQTILWNGPIGAFEVPPFDHSTKMLAQTAADLTRADLAVTVAGGGDTVAALNAAGVTQDFTYVSTAGGAFLEWLEGKNLPGIAALESAKQAA